jgi:hypothetical protein
MLSCSTSKREEDVSKGIRKRIPGVRRRIRTCFDSAVVCENE